MKRVVGTIGNRAGAPEIKLTVHTPAKASKPVPIILLVNFGGGPPPPPPHRRAAPRPAFPQRSAGGRRHPRPRVGICDRRLRGHPARSRSTRSTRASSVCTLKPGETAPAPDEWGTIGAWSWGISRILDYFETDTAVDAKRVAVFGHSRLGKTVLWASAHDERIAAVFSSCSGEMGSALARRDWGETVDDMAQNFPWQFARHFQQWAGTLERDAGRRAHADRAERAAARLRHRRHRPISGRIRSAMFIAQVAAGPVYRLLGRKDLGTTELPPLDTPLMQGDLGWHYHTGGHTATPADWQAFLKFLEKYFRG